MKQPTGSPFANGATAYRKGHDTRSTRYTARHALRLWAWGIVLELPQMRCCYRRNRRNG